MLRGGPVGTVCCCAVCCRVSIRRDLLFICTTAAVPAAHCCYIYTPPPHLTDSCCFSNFVKKKKKRQAGRQTHTHISSRDISIAADVLIVEHAILVYTPAHVSYRTAAIYNHGWVVYCQVHTPLLRRTSKLRVLVKYEIRVRRINTYVVR